MSAGLKATFKPLLVSAIYQMTVNDKIVRDYGLCSQLQRAAVSIMSNIAEGFERIHLQEKISMNNPVKKR